jgi:hypothetical protein
MLLGCTDRPKSPTDDSTKVMRSLQRLLDDLDRIRSRHPEISDTAVRDETFRVVFLGFVEQTPNYALPSTVGMFSPSADSEVKSVLARFLKDGIVESKARGLDTAEKRFAAFEELSAASRAGTPRFVFFGSAGSYAAARAVVGR